MDYVIEDIWNPGFFNCIISLKVTAIFLDQKKKSVLARHTYLSWTSMLLCIMVELERGGSANNYARLSSLRQQIYIFNLPWHFLWNNIQRITSRYFITINSVIVIWKKQQPDICCSFQIMAFPPNPS